jgi:hypothetical protein
VLRFKNRRHSVWRDRYTALFFLDEVTAFAAGHRPCFEYRRADAKLFAGKWAQAKGGAVPHAPEMDLALQSERLDGRTADARPPINDLPDGPSLRCPAKPGAAFALRGSTCCAGASMAMSRSLARRVSRRC